MKFATAASLISAASALYEVESTFSVAATGEDMDITEVYNDEDDMSYTKVVVYLHGGGTSGDAVAWLADRGYFGEDISGTKLIFPTSTLDGGVWYNSYKSGDAGTETCDFALDSACSYDMTSVDTSGQNVAALIENEVNNNGISATDIYLAGYSQGGQMTYHVTHGQLTYAIGGSFGISTYPMYPVWASATAADYTYYGTDSNWFIFGGDEDPIFDGATSLAAAEAAFAVLDPSDPTIQYSVVVEGNGHDEDCRYFKVMMAYVKDGSVTSVDDYEECEEGWEFGKLFELFFYLALIAGVAVFLF